MATYDYDVIVIGGGAGGLVTSKTAQGFGKKVALIEKSGRLGGECTWSGCIPSKALIQAASVLQSADNAGAFGIALGDLKKNTDGVMAYVRSVVQRISQTHTPEVIEKSGIKVLMGSPEFIDTHTIAIDGKKVSGRSFIIATGSSPFVPRIEGLDTVPYHTNNTIFSIDKPPVSLAIVGGGPIGIELAQAFARLGTTVTVLEMFDRILIREDDELSALVAARLKAEGITVMTGIKIEKVEKKDAGTLVTVTEKNKNSVAIPVEALLIAAGRKPNTGGLNLDNAQVQYTQKGITVNDSLRTTAPNIYACGDVVGPYQFSHMAEYQGVIAVINACTPLRRKVNYDHVLWCTFTDPELAHAGLTEQEAREKYGDAIAVYRAEYRHNDRAIIEGETSGHGKYICDTKGNLIGAHLLGAKAGELIHELQVMKSFGLPFRKIQSVIHAYPTLSDMSRQAGKKAYLEHIQNNFFVKVAKKIF